MFIILVSYRARNIQTFRRDEIIKMMANIQAYFGKHGVLYKILVVEQDNDKKFNRGVLLNAAFLEAEKLFADIPKKYIHLNVDYEINLDRPFPDEIAHFEKGFLDLFKPPHPVMGSACVFDPESYKLCNGFPNDLWGWGGDDWALYNRCIKKKIPIQTYPHLSNSGFIIEHKFSFKNNQSSNIKNIELAKRNDLLRNGLTTCKYRKTNTGEFHDGNIVYHYLIDF